MSKEQDLRLTCLQMSLENINKLQEILTPWERATQYYNYVTYGSPEKPKEEEKPKAAKKTTKKKKPGRPRKTN